MILEGKVFPLIHESAIKIFCLGWKKNVILEMRGCHFKKYVKIF